MQRVTFTLPKEISIILPLNLVAKKNGYLAGMGKDGPFTDACGPRFCTINTPYQLTAAVVQTDGSVDFEMLTDTVLEDGSICLCPHYMDYEFMTEYFHVTF